MWKDRYAELGEAGLQRRRGGRPRKKASETEPGAETKTGRGELLARVSGLRNWNAKLGSRNRNWIFSAKLAAHKSGREAICTLIAERAGQGGLTVERMCELSGVSRAGFDPTMGSVEATAGRHGVARCGAAGSGGEAVLRLSSGAAGVAAARVLGECQARAGA